MENKITHYEWEEDGKYMSSWTIQAGGYGGTTTVETNIHISRVQHLIDRYGK